MAPLIGSSLMARAASSTIAGSASCKKIEISLRCNLRKARSALILIAEELSLPAASSASVSPSQFNAITPAWRRYGSLSALSRSMAKIAGNASRRPSLPRAMMAKDWTRGLASPDSLIRRS